MWIDRFQPILKSSLLLFFLGILRLAHAAPTDDALAALHSSTDEVLSVAYGGHGTENLAARVRPLLEKSFAFDIVTRQAMGPGWRQFSAADQKRVTDRVVGTQRPKIVYGQPVELAPDRREIPTRVTTSTDSQPISVVYRMVKLPTGWHTYDVLIEGVSFIANYRAQFDGIIQNGGAPAVIRTLEAKLAALGDSHS